MASSSLTSLNTTENAHLILCIPSAFHPKFGWALHLPEAVPFQRGSSLQYGFIPLQGRHRPENNWYHILQHPGSPRRSSTAVTNRPNPALFRRSDKITAQGAMAAGQNSVPINHFLEDHLVRTCLSIWNQAKQSIQMLKMCNYCWCLSNIRRLINLPGKKTGAWLRKQETVHWFLSYWFQKSYCLLMKCPPRLASKPALSPQVLFFKSFALGESDTHVELHVIKGKIIIHTCRCV